MADDPDQLGVGQEHIGEWKGWEDLKPSWILSALLIVSLLIAGCGEDGGETQRLATTSSSSNQQQSSSSTPATTTCAGAVNWKEAGAHSGSRTTVTGPVANATYASSSRGRPTFINIGADYPSRDRFTVVIWGDHRGKFSDPPERLYRGKSLCVTGRITTYQGLPQIEVIDPDQIVIATSR